MKGDSEEAEDGEGLREAGGLLFGTVMWISDLDFLLFDLLLLTRSISLLDGQFCRNRHYALVGVDQMSPDFIQLETRNKKTSID